MPTPATRTERRTDHSHHVAVVVYDGFQSLDLAGPLDVLHAASLLLGPGRGYATRVLGPTPTATSSNGLRLTVDALVGEDAEPVDTLLVAGGLGVHRAAESADFVDAIDRLADRATRITSVCTGAFLLAATGRLTGRTAVTHWANCDQLRAENPDLLVDPDAIFVRDGEIWTSAGVTAGMDLVLALVGDDHGPDLAHQVATWLVMFTQRAGGQSQFSPQLSPMARSATMRDLQRWIAEHLDHDLSVAHLAERCAMSPRHFARLFRDEVGTTPAAYVEAVRIDAARRLLETTDLTVAAVARQVGFRSDSVLHRAFGRSVRTTPGTYRHHFTRTTRR